MSTDARRYGKAIERQDGRDFPFYDGEPIRIPAWQWVTIIVACVAGITVLSFYPAANNIQSLVPRFLFTAIMLAVFIVFTKRHWARIFQRTTARDYGAMVLFAIGNIIVTFTVGIIVKAIFGSNANTATDGIHGAGEIVAFYVGTAIQLLGEELFTILPFLAVMALCHRIGLTRTQGILIAWLATAIWFGAAHLPTYGWNFAQAFLIIGVARLVLTLAYIRTKNIAVSTGAHIINDWVLFTGAIIGAAVST
ncbi:CPBP family intramembrane glutamic endopeptidase [Curtobacterium sp. PhB115]|uniref:CPBP family intramembrane glutamic endopeptidase n=1 Tax=Curtobacterium sp. PhB115 TaxID=2485173 RepID=UPI000F4B56D1|nr:CPBP family intramembrane glutamic endopeptidase [Curtobacterium sp. PhB115]ROP74063.1 hypothetical protein EDF19_0137 [Curtobacterium sp. PhB115]